MDRLQHTVRIVAASLKNNPHIRPDEVPDLIRTIHAALPDIVAPRAIEDVPGGAREQAVGAESEQQWGGSAEEIPGGDAQTSDETVQADDEADAPRSRPMGFSEALAASRARFGGGEDMSQEDRIASAAAGTEAARAAVMEGRESGESQPESDAEAEAEVEAHAS